MKYRPDIDGLRAVAVLPVVLFHAGVGLFSGGYVGVDVFFVISGYLITGIIHEEMRQGRFTITGFYERRIRRIFPALLTVLAVCAGVAGLILFPGDLRAFCMSLLSTLGFVSNVHFYLQSGYFDVRSDSKPLLHTWSLSVEEQFYLFFPLLLWGLNRWAPRRISWVLLPLALLSFAASVWGASHAAGFTFYMAPTRVWELFLGSLLALEAHRTIGPRGVREALSLVGVALIGLAVHTFSSRTVFPGLSAAVPVAGTALLILAAPGTIVGRVLSTRPVVQLGQLSYSLYLWHWPALVFAKYLTGREALSWVESLAAVALAFGLSVVSWRTVERPFRDRRTSSRRQVLWAAAGGTALVAALAGGALLADGLPGRFSEAVVRVEAGAEDSSPRRAACHTRESRPLPPEEACVYGVVSNPRFALWGDSHAVELAYVMGELAGDAGAGLVHLSASACPPSFGFDAQRRPGCVKRNEAVLEFLAARADLETVFLIGATAYQELESIAAGYEMTVDALTRSGKRVVLIYPFPRPGFDVPHALARLMDAGGEPRALAMPFARYLEEAGPVLATFDRLVASGRAGALKPSERLCDGVTCAVEAGGDALYFDNSHLSVAGARYLSPLLGPALR